MIEPFLAETSFVNKSILFLIGLSMIGLHLDGTRIYNLVSFTNYMVFVRREGNFEQKRLVQW